MKRSNKKVIVVSVAVVGIAVFVTAGFALRRPILEQWYLWKLESEDVDERKYAAERLAEMASVRAIPRLIELFQRETKRKGVVSVALVALPTIARAIGESGSEAKEAVSALVEALEDESQLLRVQSAGSLAEIGHKAKDAIPALIKRIKEDEDLITRENSIYALEVIGPVTDAVIPTLIETLLRDNEFMVKTAAAKALGSMGPLAKDAAPALIEALGSEGVQNEFLRARAAEALGRIGVGPKQKAAAVVALTQTLNDTYKWARDEAADALKKIQGKTLTDDEQR